jgi:hypothetical protein
MIQKFEIPLKCISWNKIAAKNRWTYMKIKDEWQQATFYAIKQAKLTPVTIFPIKLMFRAMWKQKRVHDVDSLYAKATVDTLVFAKIIPDDSLQYLSIVTFTGETGADRDGLIVTIDDCG